jgi:glucose-1-phosphate thymidylyltransferase
MKSVNGDRKCCGIVPAAGRASRVQPLPVSKELFPVGFTGAGEDGDLSQIRPRVAADYLLEGMRRGGARRIFIILGQGKWDIPAYFGSGGSRGLELAYLLTEVPYGAPFTVRQALPFARCATVLFGFPDIVFEPLDAFAQLLAHQRATGAAVTLGLFPATNPNKMDMVGLDTGQRVREIFIKPAQTDLAYTWLIAVWSWAFSRYIQSYLARVEASIEDGDLPAGDGRQREYYMGHVLQGALEDGWEISGLCFDTGRYIDIGTPEDMYLAVKGGLNREEI